MATDTVAESTEAAVHVSAPAIETAASDDCSAVHLDAPTGDQNGATSMPTKPNSTKPDAVAKDPPTVGQDGTTEQDGPTSIPAQQHSAQHDAVAKDYSLRSPARRSLRKRKQPERSDPLPVEASKAAPLHSASAPASNGEGKAEEDTAGRPAKSGKNGRKAGTAASGKSAGRKQKPKSKYDAVIGRTVDIPAPIFSVDIPDLYYRGTVMKKDAAHPGSVIVRFEEDGSRYWFPVAEVERFLTDMDHKGRGTASDTIGQGSDAFAAEVLAGTLAAKKKASGMSSSSATPGKHEAEVSSGVQSKKAGVRSPLRLSRQAGGSAAEQETSSLQALAAAADSGGV